MGKTNRNTPQGSSTPDGSRPNRNAGRRQRPSGPLPREVQVSKKLSWLLRHGAEKEGLKLGVGGYVNLADLLANRMLKSAHVMFEEVKHAVSNNEKKRFGLIHLAGDDSNRRIDLSEVDVPAGGKDEEIAKETQGTDIIHSRSPIQGVAAANQGASATEEAVANADTDPSHYLIRANQGHSIKLIDTSDLLIPITIEAGNLPPTVVHGTRHEVWPSILGSGGLKPMNRNHVHFATGVPEQLRAKVSKVGAADKSTAVTTLAETETKTPSVISGMRISSTVLIFLDLRKALGRGIKFFMSENGVVLTEGDDNGVVPVELFERVEEKGGQVLVENGRVVAELKGYAKSNGKAKAKKSTKPKLNSKEPRLDVAEEDDAGGEE